MLDHMTFRVTDIAATRRFYSAALAPLGYTLRVDACHDGVNLLGFGLGEHIDTWFVDGPSPHGAPATTGCHLAWLAPDRAAVDAFHAAALQAGGRDNGAPGLRPLYGPHYYGGFAIDLEGNNVEAVCRTPA